MCRSSCSVVFFCLGCGFSVEIVRMSWFCRTDAPRPAFTILHVPESTRASLMHSLMTSPGSTTNQHFVIQVTITISTELYLTHSVLCIGNRTNQIVQVLIKLHIINSQELSCEWIRLKFKGLFMVIQISLL